MIEFEITHSEAGVRTVYSRFWKQRYALAYRLTMVASILVMVLLMARIAEHWAWYLLLGALVLFAALLLTTRDSAIRMAVQQFEQMKDSRFLYRVTEVGLWEKTPIGRVELAWPAFESWLELDGYFLLLRRPADGGQFVAFPADQLPAEARAEFLARLPRDGEATG